jgi:hypothetical protein
VKSVLLNITEHASSRGYFGSGSGILIQSNACRIRSREGRSVAAPTRYRCDQESYNRMPIMATWLSNREVIDFDIGSKSIQCYQSVVAGKSGSEVVIAGGSASRLPKIIQTSSNESSRTLQSRSSKMSNHLFSKLFGLETIVAPELGFLKRNQSKNINLSAFSVMKQDRKKRFDNGDSKCL